MQSPDFEKHPKYRFEDSNVSFIVEDRVRFDFHRHFLQRDSQFFKRMLSGRPNAPDGTYYVPDSKIHQFESLLDFFYDGMYFISPIAIPIEYWIDLLSVSTDFEFPRVRQHAIAAIDLCQSSDTSNIIEPARMIQIANLYGVEKWLKPAHSALAERDEMVSAIEAEMIGMAGLLVIMTTRELRFQEIIQRMSIQKDSVEREGLHQLDLESSGTPVVASPDNADGMNVPIPPSEVTFPHANTRPSSLFVPSQSQSLELSPQPSSPPVTLPDHSAFPPPEATPSLVCPIASSHVRDGDSCSDAEANIREDMKEESDEDLPSGSSEITLGEGQSGEYELEPQEAVVCTNTTQAPHGFTSVAEDTAPLECLDQREMDGKSKKLSGELASKINVYRGFICELQGHGTKGIRTQCNKCGKSTAGKGPCRSKLRLLEIGEEFRQKACITVGDSIVDVLDATSHDYQLDDRMLTDLIEVWRSEGREVAALIQGMKESFGMVV
ncbi:hypothetical protein V5O48_011657 [Marasmius crinis-equi]|uniref:BTB domain-containing protein n=1 Tax=Marasmius crinis-equi TaxID=585013 RepID=A0ABR3F4Y5_9AGAR